MTARGFPPAGAAPVPPRAAVVSPLAAAGALVSVELPLAAAASAALAPGGGRAAMAVTVAVLGLGGLWMLVALARAYPHGRFGLCNTISLTRATGVAVLAGLVTVPGALAGEAALAWGVLGGALGILVLDGLDGWFARRAGLVSAFGARFDLEVDSAFALTLAALVWQTGAAGAWVLALGGMRYAFAAACRIWPRLRRPLPDSRWRKLVCVLQIATLIALLAPVLAPPLSTLLAAAALACLSASFARDIRWLLRAGR